MKAKRTMFGTIEIFDLAAQGALIYTSGDALRRLPHNTDEARDYLVVRRYGRGYVARAQICNFIFDEFLLWHVRGFSWHEAFSEISNRDHQFITGEDMISKPEGSI